MKKTEVIPDYLYELYEIQRNLKTRKTLQQIMQKKPDNLSVFSNHQLLNSAFRYRISHDPGLYQHIISEVFEDPELMNNVKKEILEIFSSPLLEESINPFIYDDPKDSKRVTLPEKKYFPISPESQKRHSRKKALVPTNTFLLHCFEKAEKQGLNEFLIPIQALVYKYSFNEGTDYLLYPSDVHFSEISKDDYEKARNLKSIWSARQLNYSWKTLKFAARYLKEEEFSEGSNFLFFYNTSFLEYPESFIEFCKIMFNIVTDVKIIENHASISEYPKIFQRFLKYTFSITDDKWFERKDLNEKISILNGHFKFILTDEMIQNHYRKTEEWEIFCDAQHLLEDNYLLESSQLFNYLGRNGEDSTLKKISTASNQAILAIFKKDDPSYIENFIALSKITIQEISECEQIYFRTNLCLVYSYIQNSAVELDGIFRFNSLGFKTPFSINELSTFAKRRSFNDFQTYVIYQKKCFQFETASNVFSISAGQGCIKCKRFIGELQYYLGNVDGAIEIFKENIENPKSDFFERFQSKILLGIIQYEEGNGDEGFNLLKSVIHSAYVENKIDHGLLYNFFRMTVRGLLRVYDEKDLTKICEMFCAEFQKFYQKKTIVYAALANALYDHECLDESKRIIHTIQNDNEKEIPDANLQIILGKINTYQGKFLDAIDCYSHALKKMKEPALYRVIAINHAALNEYSLASESLGKAMKIDPSNAEYGELKKIYDSLSINEGVYLNRIKDEKIFSMFYTAESQYFMESNALNNYATIFNQYGSGVELLLKNQIAIPMRQALQQKMDSLTPEKRDLALQQIKENSHLFWLYNFIVNHSENFELGIWKKIEADITCNQKNPIIKMLDKYLRDFFGTNKAKNQIPDKIVQAIEKVREYRNPADHGAHLTLEDANRKKSQVVKSVNTLILFFDERGLLH